MIKDILDLLKIREERVKFLGRDVIVREMAAGMDMGGGLDTKDPEIHRVLFWRMFVRCVLDAETGKPIFQDDDIAELRKGSRNKLAELMVMVERVNGQDAEDNEKNSTAVQA